MIVGLGIDIVELDRIKRSWDRFGLSFARKILNEVELHVLPKNPIAFLSSRFAAKEAAVKALGTGFAHGIFIRDVYVTSMPTNAPQICFQAKATERFNFIGAKYAHLSITHGKDTAAAVVILEN